MSISIQKFKKHPKYIAQKKTFDIIADLTKLHKANLVLEKKFEKYQRLKTIWYTVAAIALILSFILVMVANAIDTLFIIQFLSILNLLTLAVSLFVGFIFNISAKKCTTLNMGTERYGLGKKVINLLERDLEPNTDLHIELDFHPSIIESKKISIAPHPVKSNWKVKTYKDKWFKAAGKFCDRTKFQLNITEEHRHVSGYKTSRSGKRKFKSKNKFKGSELNLQLRYPAEKYGAIGILEKDAIDAVKLPQIADLKNLKITPKYIQLKVNLPKRKLDFVYETIVAMLLSSYQILNLAALLSETSNIEH